MEREKIKLENRFDDLSECTEYYYDEIGKLVEVSGGMINFKKKDMKILYKYIMKSYFSSLEILNEKMKANKTVDKTEIKKFNRDYKKEHKNTISNVLLLPFKGLYTLSNMSINAFKKMINKVSHGKYFAQVDILPLSETSSNNLLDEALIQESEPCSKQTLNAKFSEKANVNDNNVQSDENISSSASSSDEVLNF